MLTQRRSLRDFIANESGATLVEFLVCLPFLIILSFAILEFSSLQLARIKTDKSAYIIANVITQLNRVEQTGSPNYYTIDVAQLDAILARVDGMLPSSTRVGAKIVVSGFTYMDRIFPAATGPAQQVNSPRLLWARGRVFGANPENSNSTVSLLGGNVTWSNAVQMQPFTFTDIDTRNAINTYGTFRCPENVVLVEVWYDYQPIFDVFPDFRYIQRRTLVSRAFLRPRAGDIEAIANDPSFNQPTALYQNTKTRGGFCNTASPTFP